jgi:hypothetical protein
MICRRGTQCSSRRSVGRARFALKPWPKICRRFGVLACHTLPQVVAAVDRRGVVVCDLGKMFPGKPEEGFEWFADKAYTLGCVTKGRKIFGCDELDNLIDVNGPPESRKRHAERHYSMRS